MRATPAAPWKPDDRPKVDLAEIDDLLARCDQALATAKLTQALASTLTR